MEETTLCRICLEPIYNFICVDCLSKSIYRWLSISNSELAEDFKQFHESFTTHFVSLQEQEVCIKCKNRIDTIICPYCYVSEVFWWLFNRNVQLAKTFSKLFNFDFAGPGYLPDIKIRNFQLIVSDKKRITDTNICDNCEQESDDLKEFNGLWLCESCRELAVEV